MIAKIGLYGHRSEYWLKGTYENSNRTNRYSPDYSSL